MIHPTRSRRFLVAAAALFAIFFSAAALAGERKAPNKKLTSKLKLAQTYYLKNRLPEALKTVNEVLKKRPKYVQARQLRGQILFTMDSVEDALKEFEKVLRIDENYTEARNWRAFALIQLERYDEAMKEYQRALEDLTYTTPEKIHANIGMLHRLLEDYDAAIASLEEAVRLNPSYAKGFYELGITYAKMGDEAKAREYFENVIRLAPDAPEAGLARDQIARMRAAS